MYLFNKNGSWIKPKYVPADALVRYWCGDEGSCLELLKSELFQACKDDHVKYRMKVNKLNYPVEVLYAEKNLFIHLQSFEKWAMGNKTVDDTELIQEDKIVDYDHFDVDATVFDQKDNDFQREIDQAVAEEKEKEAEAMRVKQAEALKVSEEKGSFTPETYEYVIATLDKCLMGEFKKKTFESDASLRQFINDIYGDLNGISVSNLNHVIAAARKRLNRTHDPKEDESEILKRYKI